MSGLDFGEIKVTSKHKQDGVWWGNAAEVARVAIDTEPETATRVGLLYAGKKAVDIVQRGYSFADPTRDEFDLELDQFVEKQELEGVVLGSHGIHTFRRHLSHGVGLFSSPDEAEQPFGLVVPGRGAIVHADKIDEYKKITTEALLRGPLENIELIDDIDIIASKAIGLSVEYAKLAKAKGIKPKSPAVLL